ncbi:MAG: hypothetical protein E7369_04460 [Clostridiales bacterium]|nr:hypothetical protein [Clostridiales bacterium]
MEKDFLLVELFELYKGLLTEKQRETFSLHYLYDLSLAEIAEQDGTARQSVHTIIKQVKAKLIEFEDTLHLKERFDEINAISDEIENKGLSDRLKEIIGK